MKFETPEMKDEFEIEVYVNPNQISVFVNDGEAVITNTVYDLKQRNKYRCKSENRNSVKIKNSGHEEICDRSNCLQVIYAVFDYNKDFHVTNLIFSACILYIQSMI